MAEVYSDLVSWLLSSIDQYSGSSSIVGQESGYCVAKLIVFLLNGKGKSLSQNCSHTVGLLPVCHLKYRQVWGQIQRSDTQMGLWWLDMIYSRPEQQQLLHRLQLLTRAQSVRPGGLPFPSGPGVRFQRQQVDRQRLPSHWDVVAWRRLFP